MKKTKLMKITFFSLIITMICISDVFADIAPNPIAGKGIITNQQTTVRMVSERVVVDLYKDSSVVECHFFMKNEGKKQQINIGFPEMNFHHFESPSNTDWSSFFVQENGKEIKSIERYTPDSILQKEMKRFAGKVKPYYEKQPWYLWNSEFTEGETKIIDVRYSLPSGVIKNGSKYFTYLLNTGSGWKGSIDTAEVIVNLKDFSKELILKTMPENYKIADNQISWKFTNLEPTTNDDIKIYYEPFKGYSEKIKKERPSPTVVLNGEIVPNLGAIDVNEILTMKVIKDLKETQKYTSGKEGVILIYTKDYAIDKLKRLIASKHKIKYSLVYDSSSDFIEKYELVIDQTPCKDKEFLLKILELKEDEIKDIKITAGPAGKTYIQINKNKELIKTAPSFPY